MNITRALSGLEPDKYSTNVLNINPGHCTDFYGRAIMDFPIQKQINLAVNGLWGYDAGTPIDGSELYIYLLTTSEYASYGFICSKSKYESDVVCPLGYSVARKLPWGVMYKNAWDGIPNFHLSHWPMPEIRLTDAEYSSLWMPLTGAKSPVVSGVPQWATLDLSTFIPDNARMAEIAFEVRYSSGAAGSAFIRSYGGQSTGLLIGSGTPTNTAPGMKQWSIRIDSSRCLQYKTTGDITLYAIVLGYSMTEPS